MHALFGIIAAVIDVIAFVPYIRGILAGQTKPNRASFGIWTVVSTVTLLSYFASGARDTIWFLAAYTIGQYIVFGLSIKRGIGGFSRLDIVCILGTAIALLLWAVTKSPVATLYISLTIEMIGFIPTIKKAYHLPQTENALGWYIGTAGAVVNLLAITSLKLQIALYPFVILIGYAAVAVLLALPRSQRKIINSH
jgi:hypothetical protein